MALRGNLARLRAWLPRACVAALVAGVVGGAASVAVAASQPDDYVARATFSVLHRPGDSEALSGSKAILAEQAARHLGRAGRADALATELVGSPSGDDTPEYRGEWVAGPGFGQLSYEVTSSDPATATAVARAVYDHAGFLGLALSHDEQVAPLLDLEGATDAAATRAATAVVVGGGAALGACAGFFLVLLAAVRPRPALARR